MRGLLAFLILPWFLLGHAFAQPVVNADFRVIAYHDVRDEPGTVPDRYTISTRNLAEHFAWLKATGHHVISLDDVLAARRGTKSLPPKAVLLTFDDGYRSLYTRVFPLLKAFGYPAIAALVGSWLEEDRDGETNGGRPMPRAEFVQPEQIREMALSGLLEFASHTYDLHRGIAGNPQGDLLPAAVARQYAAVGGHYEADAAYESRISEDLRHNSRVVARESGRAPRIVVWPYGRYSDSTRRMAREAGMPIGFTLISGINTANTPLDELKRYLVAYDPSAAELAAAFAEAERLPPMRVMHVDLDYVYDPDPVQQSANIGLLLDRVRAMGVNTVFLQAYADPDGNGAADALYFPNRHLPVRADLFSHVAWQLQTRALVNVFAWMPVLAFELPQSASPVPVVSAAALEPKKADGYPRLSPFSATARQVLREIYEDLGRHALFQGLLFHDDATLSDFEDASPDALRHYEVEWGLPRGIAAIRSDRKSFLEWTRRKSRYLTDLTLELGRVARTYQQRVLLARNLYPRPILAPESEEWFAQNLADFLQSYDYTAVMAMPYLDGADDPLPWLRSLVAAVAQKPRGLERSVFELQARDWRNGRAVNSTLLAEEMRELQRLGALSFGYYPDDFLAGHPDLSTIKPYFSLETFPYRRNGHE